LLAILVAAASLRLWSIHHGLPHVYNVDEQLHFVAPAVRMFGGSLDPDYMRNPPGLTYVLHAAFRVRFGAVVPFGTTDGFADELASDPTALFLTARIVVAALGTAAVGLVYVLGRRVADATCGLVAAGLLATAFLPVFYSKQALNDVVTLVPVTIGTIAAHQAWQRGRTRDWVLAGAAVGVATATKYTCVLLAVTVLVSAGLSWTATRRTRRALAGLALAGGSSIAAYLAVNPYTLIDVSAFWSDVSAQSRLSDTAKPGQEGAAFPYYLWTLSWGLGWVPLVAAGAGILLLARRQPRTALLLLSFPVTLLVFLGLQGRYFGRWLLPAYPACAVVAAYAAVAAARWVTARHPARRWLATGLAALLLCVQGLTATLHLDAVLGRRDTREQLRAWLDDHVPAGSRIVVEPFAPRSSFASDVGPGAAMTWRRYPPQGHAEVYQQRLRPDRIDDYRDAGYCRVVTASHQQDRGAIEGYRGARDYYRRLGREATVVAEFSPYRPGRGPERFNFDHSYDYYPSSYERPGPLIRVYRLDRCAPWSAG
jgi:hypothetical protein